MKLEGFERLQRAIAQAPDLVRAHASSAVAASTFAIAQGARARVPVREGILKGEITSNRITAGLVGQVGIRSRARAFYWRFVEFGTKYMAAQPFFRPAAEAESDVYIQRMRAIGPKLEQGFGTGRFL
jgi:HK97 gp10 family phage protein